MPIARSFRRVQEPLSVRAVHRISSAFAAAEFELLVIGLFFVVGFALKSALVSVADAFRAITSKSICGCTLTRLGKHCVVQVDTDRYSQAFLSKPVLTRDT